jgi:D-amino-acid dehydrogenase
VKTQTGVLIIGGGVIGVCAAYYLAERGQAVTLVEQGEIAAGSSYGNAGLIVPSHSIPLAAPGVLTKGLAWMLDPESPFYIRPRLDFDLMGWLLRFAWACRPEPMHRAIPVLRELGCASRALYDELAALEGLDFGYERKGLLLVFKTEHGLEEGRREAELLQKAGVQSKLLNAAQVREMEPSLQPSVVGGIYFENDAHLNPAEFVRGLARWVERKGVRLKTATEVLGFETSEGRVIKVKTTRGDFQSEQVVLAAGAWSPRVAHRLRVRLPIQAAKGYSITVKRPSKTFPTIPLLLGESRVAVTPLGTLLRFAGTLELAGLDFTINQRRVAAIIRAAREYLTGLEEFETVEIWRGLRPCTPDGLPIIGRAPGYENLVVASGHATLGVSLGPITGKLVAELVCNEPPSVDLTLLRVERFA